MISVIRKGKCEENVKPFPKLMIGYNNGVVVLFSEQGKGTVVSVGRSPFKLGHHQDTWGSLFKDCNDDDCVCLSNS